MFPSAIIKIPPSPPPGGSLSAGVEPVPSFATAYFNRFFVIPGFSSLHFGKSVLFIILGLIIALFLWGVPPHHLSQAGWYALGIFSVSSFLWGSNLVPPAVTGVLSIVLLLVSQISRISDVLLAMTNNTILFLIGAFMIGSAIEAVGLSHRMIQWVIHHYGTSPRRLAGTLFLFALFASYLIQEHVVVAVMFPLVHNLANQIQANQIKNGHPASKYPKLLLISMAWGSVIGGVGTYLGGGRALLANHILTLYSHQSISFWQWAGVAMPLSLVVGGLALGVLFLFYRKEIRKECIGGGEARFISSVESVSKIGQKRVLFIFIITVILWGTLSDVLQPESIAWFGVLLLLISRSVNWQTLIKGIPWQIILIYGASIVISAALTQTHFINWFGSHLASWVVHVPAVIVLSAISALSFLHTELFMSNAATVTSLLPLTLPLSNHGLHGGLTPTIVTYAVALPAGLAFFLPMSTPAVAMILSTEHINLKDLLLPGMAIKVVSWLILTGYLFLLGIHIR